MKILGIDPGFASMGLALLETPLAGPSLPGLGERRCISWAELWSSKPDKTVKKWESTNSRLEWLASRLVDLLAQHRVDLIVVEQQQLPTGRLQITTVMNLGRVRGLFDMLSAQGYALLEVHPLTVKKWFTSETRAEKDTVGEVARRLYPEAAPFINAVAKSNQEHITDAIAIAHVGELVWRNPSKRGLD